MLKGSTILLVDNQENSRFFMRRSLEALGLRVVERRSCDEAIEYLHRRPVDLIVIELTLPNKSGLTFLQERSKSKYISKIPTILCSAPVSKSLVNKAIELGVTDYLIKPSQISVLESKLSKHINLTPNTSRSLPGLPVRAKLKVSVSSVGPSSFELTSPIKVSSNSKIKISLSNGAHKELEEALLLTEGSQVVRTQSGFISKVNAMGLKRGLTSGG